MTSRDQQKRADPPKLANPFDALLPVEIARKAEKIGVAKAGLDAVSTLALGVLAGAFIALGAVFATTVWTGSGVAFGVARLLGGTVFSLGLILVVVAGAELFTGNNLIVMAWASGAIRLPRETAPIPRSGRRSDGRPRTSRTSAGARS